MGALEGRIREIVSRIPYNDWASKEDCINEITADILDAVKARAFPDGTEIEYPHIEEDINRLMGKIKGNRDKKAENHKKVIARLEELADEESQMLDEDKLVLARQMIRDELIDIEIKRAKESKMNDVKEEVVQMGGPVLLATVYDSIIQRICDTNQEIFAMIDILEKKIEFVSVEKVPAKNEATEKTPQDFPDTALSTSLKSLLIQSWGVLYRIREITSGIVS